jgi:hypothetical protein
VLGILRLYGRLAGKALRLALRAWPVALLVFVYTIAAQVVSGLLAPYGMVGGFAAGFVIAALVSSYLHLLSVTVGGRPPGLADLKQSFGARLWDVLSVLFALWVIDIAVTLVTRGMGPQGAIVQVMVGLTMAVFLNPVPELIYLGSSRSFALLADSGRFISKYGLEWLIPNLILGALVLFPTGLLNAPELGAKLIRLQSLFSLTGIAQLVSRIPLVLAPVMLLFLHWAMVFRGLLFEALASGGSARREQQVRDVWGRR